MIQLYEYEQPYDLCIENASAQSKSPGSFFNFFEAPPHASTSSLPGTLPANERI